MCLKINELKYNQKEQYKVKTKRKKKLIKEYKLIEMNIRQLDNNNRNKK